MNYGRMSAELARALMRSAELRAAADAERAAARAAADAALSPAQLALARAPDSVGLRFGGGGAPAARPPRNRAEATRALYRNSRPVTGEGRRGTPISLIERRAAEREQYADDFRLLNPNDMGDHIPSSRTRANDLADNIYTFHALPRPQSRLETIQLRNAFDDKPDALPLTLGAIAAANTVAIPAIMAAGWDINRHELAAQHRQRLSEEFDQDMSAFEQGLRPPRRRETSANAVALREQLLALLREEAHYAGLSKNLNQYPARFGDSARSRGR